MLRLWTAFRLGTSNYEAGVLIIELGYLMQFSNRFQIPDLNY